MGDAVWPKQRPNIAMPQEPVPPWFRGHWRGELGLGTSIFVNGVVVSCGALILVAATLPLVPVLDAGGFNLAWIGAVYATALLLYAIWLFVGIWRSAGRHTARGGSRIAALAAQAGSVAAVIGLLIFAPQAAAIYDIAFGDPGIEDYDIHLIEGGTELEYFGGIRNNSARDLEAALDAAPQVRVVHLTSPGGRASAAEQMRKLIRERGLDTYVPRGCASACATAFLGGRKRYVNGEKRIGFHAPRSPFIVSEAATKEMADDYAVRLAGLGVERSFAEKAAATPNEDIWFPTVEELIGAGVATETSEGQFAMSGFGPTPDRNEVNQAMMSVPLYAALAWAEPDIHDAVLDTYLDGLRTGRAERDVSIAVHELVRPLLAKYLPVAPDLSVNALGYAFTDELSFLPVESGDCYAIYLSDDRERRLAARETIPLVLRKRTAAAISGVITDGIEQGDPARIPTKAQKARIAQKTMAALRRHHGARTVSAFLAIARGEEVAGPDACKAMTAIYTEASKLPEAEAAIMWRSLISD